MKHIYRLLASALVLFTAAACYNQEIEGPQNPQYSDLKITARILKTRVSSDSETDGFISLKWTQGDILFGFYDDDKSNTIILRVKSVDPANGDADLDVVYVSDYNTLVDQDTHVNLIYKGDNVPMGDIDPSSYEFDSNMEFQVSLSDQDLSILPICMSADDVIDGNSFTFDFVYDCALLEIESLTGYKEQSKPNSELSNIKVTNVPSSGKYSIIEDESGKCQLKFTSNDDELKGYSFDLANSGWSINTDGEIVNSTDSDKKFLLAVVPNSDMDAEDLKNIDVEVYVGGNLSYSLPCGVHTIFGGVCYVINSRPVVARTIDGTFHATVAEAFEWARTKINGKSEFLGRENVVTLIKDHICGLGIPLPETPIFVPRDPDDEEDYDSYYWDKPLNVNSEITLDLNGCTLSIPYDEQYVEVDDDDWSVKEYFYVTSNGKLTVKDSRTGGMLESDSNMHIIVNYGTVNIENGIISHNGDWSAVSNEKGATLNVTKGTLQSNEYNAIGNEGIVNIDGGTCTCTNAYTIINWGGDVNINGGTMYSEKSAAVYSNGGTVDITGGVISNSSTIAETIQILNGAECTISGGVIYSEGDIPTIVCRSEDSDNLSKLTVTWPNETAPSNPSSDTRHEPIIYAKGATQDMAAPISTENSKDYHKAVVKINGGYLLSPVNVFFINDEPEIINLDLSEFGGFYSNAYKIRKDGDTFGASILYYDLTSSGGAEIGGKSFRADSESGGSGFYMSIFNEYTGPLYKIIQCK